MVNNHEKKIEVQGKYLLWKMTLTIMGSTILEEANTEKRLKKKKNLNE